MVQILPTVAREIEQGPSPCCDAPLVYVSPPDGYECRECGEAYVVSDDGTEDDVDEGGDPEHCQVELSSGDRAGEMCGRERPCRFHD